METRKWELVGGISNRVHLVNDAESKKAVGEIVYFDARKPEDAKLVAHAPALLAALQQIANGEGIYGAQAYEYKQIARKALEQGGFEYV